MSDLNQTPPVNEDADLEITDTVSELDMLKHRANLLGVNYSNNIGAETLRERIRAKMEELENKNDQATTPAALPTVANPLNDETEAPVKRMTIRQMLHKEQMKLVRLRITNLDPKKKDLPGEILAVANEYIGTVRKYIPYGEVTESGYHVPYCLYKQLEARKFLNIRTRKGANGQIIVEQGWVKEFALEVLPPLTQKEITRLAMTQAASAGQADVE